MYRIRLPGRYLMRWSLLLIQKMQRLSVLLTMPTDSKNCWNRCKDTKTASFSKHRKEAFEDKIKCDTLRLITVKNAPDWQYRMLLRRLFPLIRSLDGTESDRSRKVRQFVLAIQELTDKPVHLHDERLSSFEAGYLVGDLELTRKKKKKRLDAIAAASILRSFFEHENT